MVRVAGMLIIINFIFTVLGSINLCLCLYDLMINDYEAMFIPFCLCLYLLWWFLSAEEKKNKNGHHRVAIRIYLEVRRYLKW